MTPASVVVRGSNTGSARLHERFPFPCGARPGIGAPSIGLTKPVERRMVFLY